MGYIDADTHVFETEKTWSYLAESERHLAPIPLVSAWGPEIRMGVIDGVRVGRGAASWEALAPPTSVRDLSDIKGRVEWMDRAGVETQILISTFFLAAIVRRADQEAALCRSYNRWMADAYAESKGRLRWAIAAPTLSMDEAKK